MTINAIPLSLNAGPDGVGYLPPEPDPEPVIADVYVDNAVSDDTGDGSVDSPKKYITSGISLLNSGETLLIKNGTYTGAVNAIGDEASPQVFPPSGTSGNPTQILAESVGQVILDAEYNRIAMGNYNNSVIDYLNVEGIHFRNGDSGVFNLMGSNNRVTRCGFEDGMASGVDAEAPIAIMAGGSVSSLMEDCWAWGRGRYGIYTNSTNGGTNNVIFRRNIVRLDSVPAGYVSAGTRFYNGQYNAMQNCLVVDCPPVGSNYFEGAFSMGGGSSTGEPGHVFNGIMSFNNDNWAGVWLEKCELTTTISDSVFWGNGEYGIQTISNSLGTVNINHCLTGKNSLSGIRSNDAYSVTENVTNSASVFNDEYGFSDIDSIDTVSVSDNVLGATFSCSYTNGLTNDPFVTAAGFSSPSIMYPIRIENGSELKSTATDSGDIGASILNKIGASSQLYGETDWNTESSQPLWPWADQDIWLPKLRAYTASGSGGNRGIAATGQTVENYIWGYFNYDGDADTPLVTVPPFNVAATKSGSDAVLTWDAPAAISISDITSFKIYDVTGMTNPVVPGILTAEATVSGNSTFTGTVTGLSAGSYIFAVTAVGTNGESSYSYLVTVTI